MSVPVLDGYSGLVEISRGESSTTYSAQDDRHNRKVSIKVLTCKSLDATTSESLRRELRAMGLLGDHPHIVSVHDSGIADDGSPFLVMPLFTEGSYTSRVSSEGPLSWVEVADIGVKVSSALETAHQSGVLHRDIKPDNLFAGEYRTHPVLGDFGLSTLEGGGNTTTGAVAYTLKYAAPEVVEGEKQTTSSDIYSLGATFRYLLRGVPPFVAPSTTALLEAILTGSSQALPMGLPAGLVELLDSMIARDPADRPESCLEVANRLREIQAANGESQTPLVVKPATKNSAKKAAPVPISESTTISPKAARKPTTTKKQQVAASHVTDTTSKAASTQKNGNGRRWLIGGISAAVVALLAVVLVNVAKTDSSETASPSAPEVTESTPAAEETAPTGDDETELAEVVAYEPTIYEGHIQPVLRVIEQADGQLMSASSDLTFRIWDPSNSDSPSESYGSRGTWSMQALDDGRILSGTAIRSVVLVWDPTDKTSTPLAFEGHNEPVTSVAMVSEDRIVSGDNVGSMRVWDFNDSTAEPLVIDAHQAAVIAVIELPGNRIASASLDGSVKIWDLNEPDVASTKWDKDTEQIGAIVEAEDGRIVIGGSDGSLYIRDPEDQDADPVVLEGHTEFVSSVDLMEDGRIVSGSADGTVRVWDLNDETSAPIVLEGQDQPINSVVEFGDSQIGAGDQAGTVLIWDLAGN